MSFALCAQSRANAFEHGFNRGHIDYVRFHRGRNNRAGGRGSTAKPSSPPLRETRAPAMRSVENFDASGGCGEASSHMGELAQQVRSDRCPFEMWRFQSTNVTLLISRNVVKPNLILFMPLSRT